MADAEEIRSLTGLRALLAWSVVAFHFVKGALPGPLAILARPLGGGHVAVDVFFVLSGFVLARRYPHASVDRFPRRDFWARRFARVFPLYSLSMAIGALATWPLLANDLGSGTGRVRLALDALLLNAWSHLSMFRYNWAAWSLSVEAFFYVLFPFVAPRIARLSRDGRTRALVIAWALTLVTPIVYVAIDPDRLGHAATFRDDAMWLWYAKFFPLQRVPELIAGIVAARIRPPSIRVTLAAACGLVVATASGRVPYIFLHSGVLLPLVVLVISGTSAAANSVFTKFLSARPVVALGRASYATYILHVPLFLFAARFAPAIWNRAELVAAYLVALAVASLAAHRFVEEPLRKFLKPLASTVRAHSELRTRANSRSHMHADP